MHKSISYEFYEKNKNEGVLNQNDIFIKPPLFDTQDEVLCKGVRQLICKAIDYNLYTKEWNYQAISKTTNDYVFVKQSDLKPNKAI